MAGFLLAVALGIVRCGFPTVFKTLTGPYPSVTFGQAPPFSARYKTASALPETLFPPYFMAWSADSSRTTSRQSPAREATNRRRRPARTGDETDTRPQVVALRARAPLIVVDQRPPGSIGSAASASG